MNTKKLRTPGKILMWIGSVFIPIYIVLLIIDLVTNNWEWPLSVILGGSALAILGPIFGLGLVFWLMSKYGHRRVLHKLIILAIIAGVVWGGYEGIKWVVKNTEYLKFLR